MGSPVHWSLLNIGTLGQNRLWGETARRRAHVCTMTLLRSGNRHVVVDPSRDPKEMARFLDDAAGIGLDRVDYVFLTHFHSDHRRGIEAFPEAVWLMADDEIAYTWEHTGSDAPEGAILERVEHAEERIAEGIGLYPTPGHTPHHTGLIVNAEDDVRVILTGDALMTRAHLVARHVYADKSNLDTALNTIDRIAADADIVVPGHDNYFCTAYLPKRRRKPEEAAAAAL